MTSRADASAERSGSSSKVVNGVATCWYTMKDAVAGLGQCYSSSAVLGRGASD